MSAWMLIPYVERRIALGKMTREEGKALINDVIDADRRQDELDGMLLRMCDKAYIYILAMFLQKNRQKQYMSLPKCQSIQITQS